MMLDLYRLFTGSSGRSRLYHVLCLQLGLGGESGRNLALRTQAQCIKRSLVRSICLCGEIGSPRGHSCLCTTAFLVH